LQIARFHLFQVYETTTTIFLNQLLFNFFGKTRASAESPKLLFGGIGKTIRCDFAAIGRRDSERLKLNAQFANIPRGPRRMIIAVFVFSIPPS